MNIFQHKEVLTPKNTIKISPSQLANFFNYPSLWYEENIQYVTPKFIGNTASVTGTACHYIYEQYGSNPQQFVQNKEEYFRFVTEQLQEYLEFNPELASLCSLSEILFNFPLIAKVVVNEYISANIPNKTELSVCTNIEDYNDIYIAGTLDNLTGNTIVDYKNVGTKPANLTEIPFHYKIQLLAYRYAVQKQYNIPIDQIRIVYGVAPTKTLPARCFVVTEIVTDEDDKMFRDTIKLIAESIKRCEKDPTLIPLIFKSMKLEQYIGVNNDTKINSLLL